MTTERQKKPVDKLDTPEGLTERNSRVSSAVGASVTGMRAPYEPGGEPLMEAVVERKNMMVAMRLGPMDSRPIPAGAGAGTYASV